MRLLLDCSGATDEMTSEIELIRRLYERFNARDIDALLSMMVEDIVWANGMEGGYVHGRDGVRAYWTRQWAMIDPHVDPIRFSTRADGEIVVQVHQVVRDLDGQILSEKMVHHVFRTQNGRIERFDIDSRVP